MSDPARDQRHKPHFHKDNPWKDSARAASTSNVNLSSPGATIGGVTMATGDRFVAAGQTTGSQNGIYVYQGSSTAATRAYDMEQASDVWQAQVPIREGTYAGEIFHVTNTSAVTVGTTSMTWAHYLASTPITDHGGLTGLGDDDHPQYATNAEFDTHHTRHESGGADAIKLDDLATPDDNTDLNATTGHHGLLPKLSGSVDDALRGDGTFAPVASSGIGPLLLASDHAIPITFDDILQASDGSDLLYASEA